MRFTEYVSLLAAIAKNYEAAESRDANRVTSNLEAAIRLSWSALETDIPLRTNVEIAEVRASSRGTTI